MMGAGQSKPETKILLVGKTGDGKSSTGNTILGKSVFATESSPISKTKDCATGVGMVYDRRVTVIDTPGIFDTSEDEKTIREKLITALLDCVQGTVVLTIVLRVGKFTEHEREMEKKIWEYFEESNLKQSLVLFTHGDQLDNQTIEEFVKKSPELQELVDKCGGHCHVIDCKHRKRSWLGYKSNRVQVKKLLDTIDKIKKQNGCYNNELLQILEEEIQEEMNRIDPNLPEIERWEKAKKNVFEKLLIRFAGVATGTLVGALMGIAVPVVALVALLKGLKNKNKSSSTAPTDETESECGLTKESDEAEVVGAMAETAAEAGVVAGAAVGVTAVAAAVEAGVAAGVATGTAGAAVGATAAIGAAAAVEAGAAVGAIAAVEAGVAAGATAGAAAGGAVAVEAGVVAGAGIGAAAGSGIAVGVVFGAAALAGAIGGGIAGFRAVDEADSVFDAIKLSAKANFENTKEVLRRAEELPTKVSKKLKQNS